jgi:hypothetical protein
VIFGIRIPRSGIPNNLMDLSRRISSRFMFVDLGLSPVQGAFFRLRVIGVVEETASREFSLS